MCHQHGQRRAVDNIWAGHLAAIPVCAQRQWGSFGAVSGRAVLPSPWQGDQVRLVTSEGQVLGGIIRGCWPVKSQTD